MSTLKEMRQKYQPQLPLQLQNIKELTTQEGEFLPLLDEELASLFPKTVGQPVLNFTKGEEVVTSPLTIGVVFSGGQAAGGHNVITGLLDAARQLYSESRLIGFLNGPSGIVENDHILLTPEKVHPYRNQGGFDLIGSGRTKIETEEQFAASLKTAQHFPLDGLIIIGGDDSNTNAALLAEYFAAHNCTTKVLGVPKTIDGDLKNDFIEISFGFDTATKTFSAAIGDIARDALSAKKYYFFIKLMGRSASHIALTCAINTQVNYTLIGEEIAEKKQTFADLVKEITDMIVFRAKEGKNYGVVLIPEGVIEFIPEFKQLISELNSQLAKGGGVDNLSEEASRCFQSLPKSIQEQLLLTRDPHGNVQVSKIETERLFIAAVQEELAQRNDYTGSFSAQPLFFGYEGRSCYPSKFDCDYCYALGHVAALLIAQGANGYMACVGNLEAPPSEWTITGIPLLNMMSFEMRKGKQKPVIAKALVDLHAEPFLTFVKQRLSWQHQDNYLYPGPLQF